MPKTLSYSEIQSKIDASNRSLREVLKVKYQLSVNPDSAVESFILGNLKAHLISVLGGLPAKKAEALLETIIQTNAAVAEAVTTKRV